MLKYDKIPTGLFLAMQEETEKAIGESFDIVWELKKVQFRKLALDSGRDYQTECVGKMQQACSRGGGLVISATGTGKTRMVGLFFKTLIGRAVFVVDELTLLEQGRQELEAVTGERVGIVGNSEFRPDRITVATVQTLHKHIEDPSFRAWFRGLEVLIIDELHVQLNRRNFATVEKIRPLAVFGLTATLELQKKHIRMRSYATAGPVIFTYSLEKGTEAGYLTQGVVVQFLIPDGGDSAEDYQTAYKNLVYSQHRNNVIEAVVRAGLSAGRRVVVLVEWVQHLKELASRFRDIPHRKVFGQVKMAGRIRAKEKFDEGKINLIIANRVFQKGVDIKQVDMIVDACALKSKNSAVQKFGRGVRLAEDKSGLIYVDIGDLAERFELATKRRARAFKAAGIPVFKIPVKLGLNYSKVIQRATEALAKHDDTDTTRTETSKKRRRDVA